jgi:predicted protein tyrosine phosphatase
MGHMKLATTQARCGACGKVNRIQPTMETVRVQCGWCKKRLRRIDLYRICAACGVTNRIATFVGTKAIRCGNKVCREDLATPVIVERLVKVRDTLRRIERDRRYWSVVGSADLISELRHEQALMRNFAELPGYARTRRVCLDLVTEIEHVASELESKLGRTVLTTVRQVLRAALSLVRINLDSPKALTTRPANWA